MSLNFDKKPLEPNKPFPKTGFDLVPADRLNPAASIKRLQHTGNLPGYVTQLRTSPSMGILGRGLGAKKEPPKTAAMAQRINNKVVEAGLPAIGNQPKAGPTHLRPSTALAIIGRGYQKQPLKEPKPSATAARAGQVDRVVAAAGLPAIRHQTKASRGRPPLRSSVSQENVDSRSAALKQLRARLTPLTAAHRGVEADAASSQRPGTPTQRPGTPIQRPGTPVIAAAPNDQKTDSDLLVGWEENIKALRSAGLNAETAGRICIYASKHLVNPDGTLGAHSSGSRSPLSPAPNDPNPPVHYRTATELTPRSSTAPAVMRAVQLSDPRDRSKTTERVMVVAPKVLGFGSMKKARVGTVLSSPGNEKPITYAVLDAEVRDKAMHDVLTTEAATIKSLHEAGVRNIAHPHAMASVRAAISSGKVGDEQPEVLSFVHELCEDGDLSKCLRKLTHKERLQIAVDIAEAIFDMHALQVVHRDIKPENILVVLELKNGSGPEKVKRGKLTDFGFVKIPLNRGCGTPGYWAPEVEALHKKNAEEFIDGFKADIYSFGMTLRDMFPPTTVATSVSSEVTSLIERMCNRRYPHERPKADDVLKILRDELNKK